MSDEKHTHSSFDLWWLGAAIYILGSVLINLGSNMIRRGHEVTKNETPKPKFYENRWWSGGFAIFAIGNVLNFVAFMFAAQSLLVSLGSIQFIANFIFARYINGEKVSRESVISVCIIIVGIFLVVGFGSKVSRTYNLLGVLMLLGQPTYLLWLIFELILVLILQSGTFYFLHLHANEEVLEENQEGFVGMLNKWKWKGERPEWVDSKFLPLSFSIVSVCIGTQSILLGKMLSGLLLLAIGGSAVFLTVWPYLMGVFMVMTSAFYIRRLNQALRLYDALFIIPTLQGLWLFFGAIEGGIFFGEFNDMTWFSFIFYAAGLLLIVGGVLVLALKKKGPKVQYPGPDDEEDLRDLQVLQVITNAESLSSFQSLPTFSPLSSDVGEELVEGEREWDEEGRRGELLENTFCVSVMDGDEEEDEGTLSLDISLSGGEEDEFMGAGEEANGSPPSFPSSSSPFNVSPIKKLPESYSGSLPTPPDSPLSLPLSSLPASPIPIQNTSSPPSPSPFSSPSLESLSSLPPPNL